MNRRDIVYQALNHRQTDPIPYHMDFTEQTRQKLVAAIGEAAVRDQFGSFMHQAHYWGWPTEMPQRPGHFRDDFGVIWNRTGADKDIGVVDSPQIPDIEEREYQFPLMDTARLRREIERLIETREDRFVTAGFGFSMFERAWSLMGMENALMSMITSPGELDALFEEITAFLLPLIDIVLEYDVDAVYFGDDWGQQRGLIMGPDHWRRFVKPHVAQLYARVKRGGKFVIQHSCGDCHEIFPDLIAMGLDCYQTFQPEIYDLAAIKGEYGKDLSFWGGVSTQRALPMLSPRALQQEIVRVVKLLREDGGLIIAPTHAVPHDVPVENILAMAEVFQQQDRFFSVSAE